MLTVTVCSHNRAEHARRAVACLGRQADPGCDPFEILVIDNSVSGVLAGVFDGNEDASPAVRVVHEPRIGLSVARNRALAEAAGDLIVWLDDDARPREGWLNAIARSFDDPDVDAVGGPVELQRPGGAIPNWLPAEMRSYYSKVDLGRSSRVAPPRTLVGANLAMRRSAAVALGGFDPTLGHCGSTLGGGEEEELLRRIRETGRVVWYAHDAVVDHVIDEERWTRRWLLRRIAAQGSMDTLLEPGTRVPWVAALHVVVGEPRTQLRWLRQRRPPQQFAMLALGQRAFYFGIVRTMRSMARNKGVPR